MATDPSDPVRPDEQTSRSMAVFERETRSASAARTWLRDFLRDFAVPPSACADAVLVISELVTNALRHGLGEIVARTEIGTNGHINVSVTDSGPEHPEVQPADPARVGGVGLHVVDKVSQDWGVSSFPGGKTVWAIIAVAPG